MQHDAVLKVATRTAPVGLVDWSGVFRFRDCQTTTHDALQPGVTTGCKGDTAIRKPYRMIMLVVTALHVRASPSPALTTGPDRITRDRKFTRLAAGPEIEQPEKHVSVSHQSRNTSRLGVAHGPPRDLAHLFHLFVDPPTNLKLKGTQLVQPELRSS